MKIRGKEMDLITYSDNYTVKIGTVNNKNPHCVYFEIKGWVTPTEEYELDYGKVVSKLTKRTKSKVYELIKGSGFNENIFILDFDLRDSGVEYGKRSYYNCEVTLYQDGDIKELTDITPTIESISEEIISEVFEPFGYFDFYKKKK
jgi:hypothetical protein